MNILHSWKPEQPWGIVALSKETNKPISQRIKEAALLVHSPYATFGACGMPLRHAF